MLGVWHYSDMYAWCYKHDPEADMIIIDAMSAICTVAQLIMCLDRAVVSALTCHRCAPGSNPGVRMWQGSDCPSKVGDFTRIHLFPPPRMTKKPQHLRLRERVYKFFELSV